MFSFFLKKKAPVAPLPTDVHSHLLPGIDDGVKTIDESLRVIDMMLAAGYRKLITTPHIMTDFFGNTSEKVAAAHQAFLPELRQRGYDLPFEAAAEYYLDEQLYHQVQQKEKFLTFGDRYLLFETNPLSEPLSLNDFIFQLSTQGYKPVMAHPERYQYMTVEKATDLHYRGVHLQINQLSLMGGYGPVAQRLANKLIDARLCDLLGSDCHNEEHARALEKVRTTAAYRKALALPLLNYHL